jgi:hypothetical protein
MQLLKTKTWNIDLTYLLIALLFWLDDPNRGVKTCFLSVDKKVEDKRFFHPSFMI